MPTIITEFEEKANADTIGVQILFAWTRSIISGSSLLRKEDKLGVKPCVEVPPVDNSSHVVIDFSAMDMPFIEHPRVLTRYQGEPLRVLAQSLITNEAQKYDSRKARQYWVDCRRSSATTPAQKFFLDLDIGTHTSLLFCSGMTKDEIDKRKDLIAGVLSGLQRSIETRANTIMHKNHLPSQQMLAQLADLIRDMILFHFPNDMKSAHLAFDAFAGGWLRQDCEIGIKSLKLNAADPDSAYIFFFAELAKAILDTAKDPSADQKWQERADFWRGFLNVFVRMQKIYLSRWNNAEDPECFNEYGKTVPPPSKEVDVIRDEFELHGDDEVWLDEQMMIHLSHVIQGTPQCNGACCLNFEG